MKYVSKSLSLVHSAGTLIFLKYVVRGGRIGGENGSPLFKNTYFGPTWWGMLYIYHFTVAELLLSVPLTELVNIWWSYDENCVAYFYVLIIDLAYLWSHQLVMSVVNIPIAVVFVFRLCACLMFEIRMVQWFVNRFSVARSLQQFTVPHCSQLTILGGGGSEGGQGSCAPIQARSQHFYKGGRRWSAERRGGGVWEGVP